METGPGAVPYACPRPGIRVDRLRASLIPPQEGGHMPERLPSTANPPAPDVRTAIGQAALVILGLTLVDKVLALARKCSSRPVTA